MRLLVLGHTAFLGRAVVHAAVERNYEVVVLGRSDLDRDRLPEVEWIDAPAEDAGFRLGGRNFEAVVDLSPVTSASTLRTSLSLSDRAPLYVLVTSTSVYRDFAQANIDEAYPVSTLPPGTEERPTDFATYGARLALCEQRVAEATSGRCLIVRPGLLAGPYDVTDRMPRLLRRIAEGGQVLAGGSENQPVQILDVRDLADFILDRAAAGTPGVLNATGDSVPLGQLLTTAAHAIDADASFLFPGDDFLARSGLTPMSQLPLWVPEKGYPGFFRVSSARAKHLGLRPRPMADTFAAAFADLQARDASQAELKLPHASRPPTALLTRAAEQRLIAETKKILGYKNGSEAVLI